MADPHEDNVYGAYFNPDPQEVIDTAASVVRAALSVHGVSKGAQLGMSEKDQLLMEVSRVQQALGLYARLPEKWRVTHESA